MKKLITSLAVLVLALQTTTNASALTVEQRLRAAEDVVDGYIHAYAPLEWKEELLGISFPEMVDEFYTTVARSESDQDFYGAVVKFVATFQDSHVRAYLPSTYQASLPFTADAFGDEVIITVINRKELPAEKFPVAVGDRLVSIGGVPVDVLMEQLSGYVNKGQPASNRRFAARALTKRRQRDNPYTPYPSYTQVVTYSEKEKVEQRHLVEWKTKGYPFSAFEERETEATTLMEWMVNQSKAASLSTPPPAATAPEESFDDVMTEAIFDGWNDEFMYGGLYNMPYPFFPIWKDFEKVEDAPMLTGIISVGDYKIGFLRIRNWRRNPNTIPYLEQVIPELEAKTDALIIDQTGNPGGSICLGETVAGFFLEQEAPTLKFQMKPTRRWAKWIEEDRMEPNLTLEEQKNGDAILDSLYEAMANGDPLTEPMPLCKPDGTLKPYTDSEGQQIVYRKPKLLVVNELSCSTADMFPAMMQDAGAVTVFGARTMGCGGSVYTYQLPGMTDINIRITISLALRQQETPTLQGTMTRRLENVGVVPDIPYEITLDDYRDNYTAYRDAMVNAVIGLIGTQGSTQ